MRISLTTLLDIVGLILALVGSFALDWRVGVMVAGFVLLAFSYGLARADELMRGDT